MSMVSTIRKFIRLRRRTYEELATEYVDAVIDGDGAKEMERRLERAPELAAELEEMRAVQHLLRSQAMVEPPRSFALPLRTARTPARTPVSEPRSGGVALRWLQSATAAAAVVLVALATANVVVTPAVDSTPAPAITNLTAPQVTPSPAAESALAPQATAPPTAPTSGPMTMMGAAPMEGAAATPSPPPPVDAERKAEDRTFMTDAAPAAGPPAAPPEDTGGSAEAAQPPATAEGRTWLEWAQLAASLLTGLLALAIVAMTWGARGVRQSRVE